jgi:hypothetical protein
MSAIETVKLTEGFEKVITVVVLAESEVAAVVVILREGNGSPTVESMAAVAEPVVTGAVQPVPGKAPLKKSWKRGGALGVLLDPHPGLSTARIARSPSCRHGRSRCGVMRSPRILDGNTASSVGSL